MAEDIDGALGIRATIDADDVKRGADEFIDALMRMQMQANNAAKVCFQSYLDNYGSSANHEDKQIIDHIALYLEKYGGSRFQRVEDNVQLMSERAGYYRASDNLYLFGENSFKQECLPFDLKMVVNVLKKYDLLKTNSGSNKLKVNNANVDIERAYAIKGEIINFQI